MTGAGKTNLLETVTEQDIARGVPIIFIDGKGDKKLLSELLPSIEAAGRMPDLRIIDPMRPDISARYNPFWAPQGNAEEHVAFVFESFNMEKDFFEGHQRVYLENIARVLHYSGKRFNFHDVLVCAYDQAILKKQMKAALDRVDKDPAITGQQRLTLTMSVRNLLESFEDKERVSKIQGLINEMMDRQRAHSLPEPERQCQRTGGHRPRPDAAPKPAADDRPAVFAGRRRPTATICQRHHG
jgi:hypothetical protein